MEMEKQASKTPGNQNKQPIDYIENTREFLVTLYSGNVKFMVLESFVYVAQSYLLVCSGSGTESIFLGVYNKLIINKREYWPKQLWPKPTRKCFGDVWSKPLFLSCKHVTICFSQLRWQ